MKRWIYEVTYTMKTCPMLTLRLDDLYEDRDEAEEEAENLKLELAGEYAVIDVRPRKLVLR
ncbi:hypothetical protein HOBO_160 [Bacillus phage Hobo]|uniref:Uncharacterized protein n=2 Tax=Caeruleovirus BM15 TaxID=1985178 RepID=A0A0S2MUK2_9CAUD|nr:hypothetical protein FD732_gp182 [Bacillus phage BM15]ALO79567.1 hypothetical protein BM10_163 [Bacillus phage BM15]AXQ66918.1 hypothetical protein HOBO_160 [Bacillus phage Hobo]